MDSSWVHETQMDAQLFKGMGEEVSCKSHHTFDHFDLAQLDAASQSINCSL